MPMFNWGGMARNIGNLAKWGAGAAWGTTLGKVGMVGAGLGFAAGALNPDRSAVGGAFGTLGYGALGGGIGAGVGAAMGAYSTRGMTGRWAPAFRRGAMMSRAAKGGAYGLLGGIGFGALRAGLGSNRPVNRIRGLHH